MIEIRHRTSGAVIWSGEAATVREAVVKCINAGVSLSGAYLSGAYLSGAYLSGADLSRAYLSGADLSGAYLSGADLSWADLSGADLSGADLSGADLSWADLSWAYLSGADLSGADLSGANLSGANLSWAYLSGADLSGASGFLRERHIELLMLLDQPGPIRAYKMVSSSGKSPMAESNGFTAIQYEIGRYYEVADASDDVTEDCGHGLHVATLPWCLKNMPSNGRVFIVEFTAADIACIPTATDGKFRVKRFTVVGEKDVAAIFAREKSGRDEWEAERALKEGAK